MRMLRPKYFFALIIVIVFLAAACRFMPFPSDFEDSYIMHRYAQNGADGSLYTWNKGCAPTQGTTGIAWVTLVSLVSRFAKLAVISVNSYLGLFFAVLTLLAVYATAERRLCPGHEWIALSPLIPLALSPYYVRFPGNGLETSAALFLVALSIYLGTPWQGTAKRALWLGLFTGFTFLIRPDLPLFPFCLFLAALWISNQDRKQHVRQTLALLSGAALSTGLSLVAARILTGTAFPLAASLKIALGDLVLGRLPGSVYRFILGFQLNFFAYLAPLVLLAIVASLFPKRLSTQKYLPIYIACAVYFLYLFTVLPIMDIAFRFQMPLLIGLSFALLHLFDSLQETGVSKQRTGRFMLLIVGVLALADLPGLFAGKKEAQQYKTDHAAYQQLGVQLHSVPGISIASTEAGKLAFYSGQKFLDIVGLNDRFIAENKKKADYPQLLSAYLRTEFGVPDVYVRPLHPGVDSYAYLEILPDFESVYTCNKEQDAEAIGIVVCIENSSPHQKEIAAALDRAGIGVELPHRP